MKPHRVKFINLTVLLCCSYLATIAQQYSYVPMPTSKARWLFVDLGSKCCPAFQWELNGDDTIINGLTYKEIMQRGYELSHDRALVANTFSDISSYPDKFVAALREDNKKVYVIDYTYDNSEKLLIDFNLKAGDTMDVFWRVAYEDTVIINQTPRRQLTLKDNEYGIFTRTYTEGYGPINFISGFEKNLKHQCFHTDEGYYPSNIPCGYIWPYDTPVSVAGVNSNKKVLVYPVPFSGVVRIDANKASRALLYNMLGAEVLQQPVSGKTELHAEHLPPGTYFLKLQDNRGVTIHTQRLVKE